MEETQTRTVSGPGVASSGRCALVAARRCSAGVSGARRVFAAQFSVRVLRIFTEGS